MPRPKKLRVSVLLRSDRGTYYLQYRDPTTGRKVRRSTDATTKRAAEREAAKWEQELQQSIEDRRSGRMLWDEFRRLYEDEVLSSLAVGTDHKVASVFNVLERAIGPKRLCDLSEESLSRYQNWLRQNGRSESTIKGHLAHIKSSLSWAKNHKLISAVPSVKMPKRAKKSKVMKGRAITLEEFERMLSKIEAVLFPPGVLLKEENRSLVVASWEYLLRGLWLSGLRLDESMQLHWTDRTLLCVEDLDKRQPMLWIPGGCQKSGQDAVLPMAPEFAEFLRETAADKRQGYVFNPLPRRHRYGDRIGTLHVSKTISRIGEAANVKVHEGRGKDQVKYASAHDFRRSFGERWAPRVTSTVLRELMRHEDIQTTLRYYVGENAQRTAALLWEVHRGLGDQMGTRASGSSEDVDASPEATGTKK